MKIHNGLKIRSSKEIKEEIRAIRKKDSAYNNFMNEGGEGYEHDSVKKELLDELSSALEAEFCTEWTLEVYEKRKARWSAEVAKITKEKGGVTFGDQINLQKIMGFTFEDLKKAKKLLAL